MRGLLIGMIWATISTTVALHFGALIVCSSAPHDRPGLYRDTMWVAASSLSAEAAAQR